MQESHLFAFLGFEPDPARYEQSHVLPGDSYDVIACLVKRSSKVLEIGCGTGTLLECLSRRRDCKVFGIEPNKDRADLARQKGLTVIQAYLAPETRLPAASYDYIILADVLEHLDDPSMLLLNSKKYLKPGGSYIISVPNMIHWSVRLQILLGKLEYSQYGLLDATHLRWFTQKSIMRYLERLNFLIESVTYTNGLSLPCYYRVPLFARIPVGLKLKILGSLSEVLPNLFACQNIIVARPL